MGTQTGMAKCTERARAKRADKDENKYPRTVYVEMLSCCCGEMSDYQAFIAYNQDLANSFPHRY